MATKTAACEMTKAPLVQPRQADDVTVRGHRLRLRPRRNPHRARRIGVRRQKPGGDQRLQECSVGNGFAPGHGSDHLHRLHHDDDGKERGDSNERKVRSLLLSFSRLSTLGLWRRAAAVGEGKGKVSRTDAPAPTYLTAVGGRIRRGLSRSTALNAVDTADPASWAPRS